MPADSSKKKRCQPASQALSTCGPPASTLTLCFLHSILPFFSFIHPFKKKAPASWPWCSKKKKRAPVTALLYMANHAQRLGSLTGAILNNARRNGLMKTKLKHGSW